VLDSALLPKILDGTRLHLGLVIALAMALFYYIFMWKLRVGYEARVVGLNPQASQYAGINPKRIMLLVMVLAGGMAGIAGGGEL
jgi:simple sugar transport system permease protein